MSVTKKIITTEFSVDSANAFVNSFNSNSDQFFVFAGKHIPYPNSDSTIPLPNNSVQAKITDVYNNMVFAKKVSNTDVIQMVSKNIWTSNTKYSEYSHTDGALLDTGFYVTVDDDSEYNVYKCLYNNGNTYSTSAPSRVGSSADLEPIITSDGYMWKYMWTITKNNYEKFATKNYIPVTANSVVIENAVPGSIEVIKVIDGGAGYHNYISEAILNAGDIEVGGDTTLYGAPSSASSIDDYYKGCVMKITSGAGVNQYRRVIAYNGSGATKLFILDSEFSIKPSVNDTYDIMPYIYVWGDGNETTAAEGLAVVNTNSNSIYSVEVLSSGRGYRTAFTSPGTMPSNIPITSTASQINIPDEISLDANFKAANLEPIISPPHGHGGNPWLELGATKVCVYTKFSNTENGVFPTENDFRQIGLVKNPEFANVTISLVSNSVLGSFSVGEYVYVYNPIKLYGAAEMSSGSNVIQKKEYGLISTTISILNGGTGYDNTSNNELVFDNSDTGGGGATATFSNNGSGVITSVTVTSQGNNYITAPTVTVNPTAAAGGASAQLNVSLANLEETEYNKSLESNDYIIISDSTSKFVGKVNTVSNAYSFTTSSNTSTAFANAVISKLELSSYGIVSAVTSTDITLKNVIGPFNDDATVVGVQSGATGVIDSSTINDRSAGTYNKALQLTKLIGDYTIGGSPFIEDELISQDTIINLFQGNGYLHHIEINAGSDDDIAYVTNKTGQFNLDPDGNEVIRGTTSSATLENLSAKYPGEFVVDSGEVLYYENLDPITRDGNKSEIIKLIFEF